MKSITFSSLPAEIHVSIAKYCENYDLISLCLTSKWVNERCLRVLYRHVDLQLPKRLDQHDFGSQNYFHAMFVARIRQQRFVRTLLSHPEYGNHVRFLKGVLFIPDFDDRLSMKNDMISYEELWHVLQSLRHVQCVEVGSRNYCLMVPTKQIPNDLFQSATSVRLVGQMQYGLAKSILNAINPATLKHLCLDMVQDYQVRRYQHSYVPGDRGEDGQIIAFGATSGLLTTLTGRCTALRTLILRREEQTQGGLGWHAAAEDASYIEWASFIRSVQGTVEKFKFEHGGEFRVGPRLSDKTRSFGIMDERFQRLLLPTIVSGSWPCLTMIELRGVKDWSRQYGDAALTMTLRAVLGGKVKILVDEKIHVIQDVWEPSYDVSG